MNYTPSEVKVSLLSHGIDFPIDFFTKVKYDFYFNQFIYGRTSKGVALQHKIPQALKLGNDVIVSTLRRPNSPWNLKLIDNNIILFYKSTEVQEIFLPEKPAYFGKFLSDGTPVENYVAVAGEYIPGFFIYPHCYYFEIGKQCKFCSLKHTRKTVGKHLESNFESKKIGEATRIFQNIKWKDYPVVFITTGTFPNNDEGTIYTSKIINAISENLQQKVPIHLLTIPPDNFDLLELYKASGVTSIAFNMEIWDANKFKEICPAKDSTYGYEKFKKALLQAKHVFGAYNVYCGFVWGLESIETLTEGYTWCLDNGIGISSNVFHTDQGSAFAKHPHPSENEIKQICKIQSEMHSKYPSFKSLFSVSMRSTLDFEIFRGDFQ